MKILARTTAKKSAPAAPRKRAKKYPKDASGLSWLLDEKLPPVSQLPENPVLVLRRL